MSNEIINMLKEVKRRHGSNAARVFACELSLCRTTQEAIMLIKNI